MTLTGKTAIVTGGAVRIGREIARTLAQHGVHVCIHYGSSEAAAIETLAELQGLGVNATRVQADLSDPMRAAEKIVAHAEAQLGLPSILINSAAIFEAGTLLNTAESAWDRHLDINLKAPFFLTQAFARRFLQAVSSTEKQSIASPQITSADTALPGAIVNIVDWRGTHPRPGHAAYTVSKGGLVTLTTMLAQELGPQIRVNAVAPGAILPAPGESAEDFQLKGLKNPLLQTGTPGDIAEAVLYLLRARFLTGEVLHVTGGEQLS